MPIKRIKSFTREQTHIVMVAIGPDAQHMIKPVRNAIRRENAKRASQGKSRISYQIETATG